MRLARSVFSIRPLEIAFKSRFCRFKTYMLRQPSPGIHQKIGLQSDKRRLQSGGKSTYSHSRATIPESQHSPVEKAIRERQPSIHPERESQHGNRRRSSRHVERWQPPANTQRSGSFPGTTTQSMSSAWSVAKSSIQKNFAIWRSKRQLKPKIFRTIPKDDSQMLRTIFARAGITRVRSGAMGPLIKLIYLAPAPLETVVPVRRDTIHA
jgi:hypothetical protein